jgi:putative tricarboxylic transport membrane protein
VLVMAVFGLFGYLLIKIKCEPAPLILGFILGPMLEENFRRSLIVSRGSWWVFLKRPICVGFLVLSLIFLLLVVLPSIRRGRDEAFKEG